MGTTSTVAFQGLNELNRALIKKSHLEAAKTIVAKNGADLQKWSSFRAPVDTGFLMRSIGLQITDGGLSAVVKASAHYAGYVEYGTRFMTAQPFIKPSFNQVKHQFNADLQKLVR